MISFDRSATERLLYGCKFSPQLRLVVLALPIASCGLRLDNEAVRVAVALRLGLSCATRQCGTSVDSWRLPVLTRKRAPGKLWRCFNAQICSP